MSRTEYASNGKTADTIKFKQVDDTCAVNNSHEKNQLLLSMGRFVSGININDKHLVGPKMGFQIQLKEPVNQPEKIFAGRIVFKQTKRRRRGKIMKCRWKPTRYAPESWLASQ